MLINTTTWRKIVVGHLSKRFEGRKCIKSKMETRSRARYSSGVGFDLDANEKSIEPDSVHDKGRTSRSCGDLFAAKQTQLQKVATGGTKAPRIRFLSGPLFGESNYVRATFKTALESDRTGRRFATSHAAMYGEKEKSYFADNEIFDKNKERRSPGKPRIPSPSDGKQKGENVESFPQKFHFLPSFTYTCKSALIYHTRLFYLL